MERTLTVRSADGQETITGVRRDDWGGVGDACPGCGRTRYRRFTASGERVDASVGAVSRRSDYWGSETVLLVRCLGCGELLRRHPAFELLYGTSGGLNGGSRTVAGVDDP